MYTFSIKRNHMPLVEITIEEEMIERDDYFRSLIEKCFERVFQTIKDENKEEVNFEQDTDLEEDD